MVLKLYNTLSRKKETFVPLKKGSVGMYSCGPTVYWYQHIGNLRSYIFSDILKRVLLYNGYKVKHVMNVTDVGHLSSDADTGEDKMEKAAQKEGKRAEDIAHFYLKIFQEDLKKLNIITPDAWPKATEHITEQIKLIENLEKKGFTYKTDDGIYFDTSRVKMYGILAKLKKEGLQAGKRVVLGHKKNPTDFALWKFSENLGERQQEWKSPWGVGFPGWHIECSAMATKYLGKQFDIHTGGEDHIPVHHTNEIAQSEAGYGKKPWVHYWLHGAFLNFKGEKVSKSKGGLYTLSELEEKDFDPLDYRYFMLTAHYRKQLNFTLDNLSGAQNSLSRLRNIIFELKDDGEINKQYLVNFEKTINADLDMPGALHILWHLVRDVKAKGKIKTIKKMDEIFGLDLLKLDVFIVTEEVSALIQEREQFRKDKNWAKSDELRDLIKKKGYLVEDRKGDVKVTKILEKG
jgi:cysteinyl-tRNA synthetase